MLISTLNVLVIAIVLSLLSGCASNSALTLMNASKHTDLIVPPPDVIEQELKERSLRLGKIYFDSSASVQTPSKYPDDFFRRLIQQQVQKGFINAILERGSTPANVVDVVIEEMKFTRGKILIPDPSILRIRIEVRNVNGSTLMKGGLESRYLSATTIILPGVVGILPTAFEGQEWTAVIKMIPAVAIAITKTMAGLQLGKKLDEIEIYPDALAAGGVIMPDLFLRGSPYGISELARSDFEYARGRD